MSNQTATRPSRSAAALVLVWLVAVPVSAALGVLALRAAGGDSSPTVITAGQAAALAQQTPPDAGSAPTPTPASRDSPVTTSSRTVERRVPGAVLGLRCEQDVPVLVWSVPDAGWRIEDVEYERDELSVRIEAGDDEVRVDVACSDGTPRVIQATRRED